MTVLRRRPRLIVAAVIVLTLLGAWGWLNLWIRYGWREALPLCWGSDHYIAYAAPFPDAFWQEFEHILLTIYTEDIRWENGRIMIRNLVPLIENEFLAKASEIALRRYLGKEPERSWWDCDVLGELIPDGQGHWYLVPTAQERDILAFLTFYPRGKRHRG